VKIAVINSGSSSLKFKLFEMQTQEVLKSVLIEHIGEEGGEFKNHHDALDSLDVDFSSLDAIGHRVVHGGETLTSACVITSEVLKTIESLIPLAPLHNPANLEGIVVAKKRASNILQVAVFDTAFHSTMPKEAYLYALPLSLYEKYNIRRYGFHGTSHSYIMKKAAKKLGKKVRDVNLITLHLGNGASICAIKNGKSIDTSMGLTPLEGLVMGTRCGDIDPAIIFYLARSLNLDIKELDNILNKKSGLKGLCGTNDMREVEQRIKKADKKAELAFEIFCYRIRKYIGAYTVAIGRVDALVFTGGIGEHSSKVREKVCSGLEESLGIKLDTIANSKDSTVISKKSSKIKLFVIATNEELEIAKQTYNTFG